MKTRILSGVVAIALLALTAFSVSQKRSVRRSLTNSDPTGNIYIIVDKSDYELRVYDDEGWYATYPVVFGSKSLEDKMMEGDRKTPEGTFKIISKKPHQKWHKMLMLDYPNKESWDKFKSRKQRGVIPKSARIGGGIAIHGTWPNDDIVVDDFTNWTQGCISVKNEDLDDLFQYVNVGTTVKVQR
jgi:murein L,D-transpeptidase YafK